MFNRHLLRKELSKLLSNHRDYIIDRWSLQIFRIPAHRQTSDIVPRKIHAKGMSEFIDAFIYDIAHPKVRRCDTVQTRLVFKDYLSLNTANDAIHGLIILRGVVANILIKVYRDNFKKLKDATNILIAELDKRMLCFSQIYKQRDFSRLQTIMRYGKKLITIHDIDKLCSMILEAAIKESNSDRGSVMLLENGRKRLIIKSSVGIPKKYINTKARKAGGSIAGSVAKTGRAIIINKGERTAPAITRALRGLALVSAMSIPILSEGEVLGVINLGRYSKKVFFDEEDLELLLILAYEAGAAITNCRLFGELQEHFVGSIISLASALDARDHYTHGHSSKVTKYAKIIAKTLGLGPEEINDIHYASMLHDIGKIGIPDKILLKPGRLTEDEFEVVKKHPVFAVNILKHMPRLKSIVPIVYHEHERYDGAGYVDGLRGEEIPMGSRIIAVADAYEAMTSNRPYRKALGRKEALRRLKEASGTQFDPKVVRAFLSIEKNI